MDHILARIRGVKMEDLKNMLKADMSKRHIWRNTDDPDEILFIFTTADLNRARKFIEMEHAETLKENPNANLPEMLFLRGE
jgi:hypothetical protein